MSLHKLLINTHDQKVAEAVESGDVNAGGDINNFL